MYVNELESGMLLKPEPGFRYYIQESKSSDLPRLRLAPEVIATLFVSNEIQGPVMYLGTSKKDASSKSRSKIRTVMVDGQVAFVEGREFRKLAPISS